MTHTLHRRGSRESFQGDYIIFAMTAKGFNKENSRHALREFEEIVSKYKWANIGDMKTGGYNLVGREAILENVQDTSIVHAVLTSKEDLRACLKELREADLGVSINITGIVEDVEEVCRECGIERHTVEVSLGIRGRLDRLPAADLLEITTMCGHGMVSQHLARQMLLDIKKGRRTAGEAGDYLATPCVCGVFNPRRAQMILEELVDLWCFDEA